MNNIKELDYFTKDVNYTKTLIQSEEEYRKYCFDRCWNTDLACYDLDMEYGLIIRRECWDFDEEGNDIDEEGNKLPINTWENIKLCDWVKKLKYPIVLIETPHHLSDNGGIFYVGPVIHISLTDFNK